ncbi:hypothetical protein GQ54DRAFT_337205 [Martensiomyces pterosporus]|nr:hypothetical protein GQ54DRAFT_337205 [Martensiomyces pterosporus]
MGNDRRGEMALRAALLNPKATSTEIRTTLQTADKGRRAVSGQPNPLPQRLTTPLQSHLAPPPINTSSTSNSAAASNTAYASSAPSNWGYHHQLHNLSQPQTPSTYTPNIASAQSSPGVNPGIASRLAGSREYSGASGGGPSSYALSARQQAFDQQYTGVPRMHSMDIAPTSAPPVYNSRQDEYTGRMATRASMAVDGTRDSNQQQQQQQPAYETPHLQSISESAELDESNNGHKQHKVRRNILGGFKRVAKAVKTAASTSFEANRRDGTDSFSSTYSNHSNDAATYAADPVPAAPRQATTSQFSLYPVRSRDSQTLNPSPGSPAFAATPTSPANQTTSAPQHEPRDKQQQPTPPQMEGSRVHAQSIDLARALAEEPPVHVQRKHSLLSSGSLAGSGRKSPQEQPGVSRKYSLFRMTPSRRLSRRSSSRHSPSSSNTSAVAASSTSPSGAGLRSHGSCDLSVADRSRSSSTQTANIQTARSVDSIANPAPVQTTLPGTPAEMYPPMRARSITSPTDPSFALMSQLTQSPPAMAASSKATGGRGRPMLPPLSLGAASSSLDSRTVLLQQLETPLQAPGSARLERLDLAIPGSPLFEAFPRGSVGLNAGEKIRRATAENLAHHPGAGAPLMSATTTDSVTPVTATNYISVISSPTEATAQGVLVATPLMQSAALPDEQKEEGDHSAPRSAAESLHLSSSSSDVMIDPQYHSVVMNSDRLKLYLQQVADKEEAAEITTMIHDLESKESVDKGEKQAEEEGDAENVSLHQALEVGAKDTDTEDNVSLQQILDSGPETAYAAAAGGSTAKEKVPQYQALGNDSGVHVGNQRLGLSGMVSAAGKHTDGRQQQPAGRYYENEGDRLSASVMASSMNNSSSVSQASLPTVDTPGMGSPTGPSFSFNHSRYSLINQDGSLNLANFQFEQLEGYQEQFSYSGSSSFNTDSPSHRSDGRSSASYHHHHRQGRKHRDGGRFWGSSTSTDARNRSNSPVGRAPRPAAAAMSVVDIHAPLSLSSLAINTEQNPRHSKLMRRVRKQNHSPQRPSMDSLSSASGPYQQPSQPVGQQLVQAGSNGGEMGGQHTSRPTNLYGGSPKPTSIGVPGVQHMSENHAPTGSTSTPPPPQQPTSAPYHYQQPQQQHHLPSFSFHPSQGTAPSDVSSIRSSQSGLPGMLHPNPPFMYPRASGELQLRGSSKGGSMNSGRSRLMQGLPSGRVPFDEVYSNSVASMTMAQALTLEEPTTIMGMSAPRRRGLHKRSASALTDTELDDIMIHAVETCHSIQTAIRIQQTTPSGLGAWVNSMLNIRVNSPDADIPSLAGLAEGRNASAAGRVGGYETQAAGSQSSAASKRSARQQPYLQESMSSSDRQEFASLRESSPSSARSMMDASAPPFASSPPTLPPRPKPEQAAVAGRRNISAAESLPPAPSVRHAAPLLMRPESPKPPTGAAASYHGGSRPESPLPLPPEIVDQPTVLSSRNSLELWIGDSEAEQDEETPAEPSVAEATASLAVLNTNSPRPPPPVLPHAVKDSSLPPRYRECEDGNTRVLASQSLHGSGASAGGLLHDLELNGSHSHSNRDTPGE